MKLHTNLELFESYGINGEDYKEHFAWYSTRPTLTLERSVFLHRLPDCRFMDGDIKKHVLVQTSNES